MKKKYIIRLSAEQRRHLTDLIRNREPRQRERARVLDGDGEARVIEPRNASTTSDSLKSQMSNVEVLELRGFALCRYSQGANC